jgi:hypothetical protein
VNHNNYIVKRLVEHQMTSVFNGWQKHWKGCNGWTFSAVRLSTGKRCGVFEVSDCYLSKDEAAALVEQLNVVSGSCAAGIRNSALEEAAKVCDALAVDPAHPEMASVAHAFAYVIRALKAKTAPVSEAGERA